MKRYIPPLSLLFTLLLVQPSSAWICGDANSDTEVNIADVVYLINYLFIDGPAPEPLESGDVNLDTEVRREFLRDEPRGGFVTEVACPYCGQAVTGNIPSTPERKIVGFVRNYEVGVHSTNKCTNRRCVETFFVHRYSDGSWIVRQSSDGARQA